MKRAVYLHLSLLACVALAPFVLSGCSSVQSGVASRAAVASQVDREALAVIAGKSMPALASSNGGPTATASAFKSRIFFESESVDGAFVYKGQTYTYNTAIPKVVVNGKTYIVYERSEPRTVVLYELDGFGQLQENETDVFRANIEANLVSTFNRTTMSMHFTNLSIDVTFKNADGSALGAMAITNAEMAITARYDNYGPTTSMEQYIHWPFVLTVKGRSFTGVLHHEGVLGAASVISSDLYTQDGSLIGRMSIANDTAKIRVQLYKDSSGINLEDLIAQ